MAGDLNGDADPDLVATSWGSGRESKKIVVLLGRAGTRFAKPVAYRTSANPMMSALADLDGDGDLDVVVAQWEGAGGTLLYENAGDGTLTLAGTTLPQRAEHIVASDLDGDGALDLQSADLDEDTVSARLGNGDGTFGARTTYPVGDSPGALLVDDLDRDGRLDVTAAFGSSDSISVLRGRPGGELGAPKSFPVGYPVDLAAGDYDGDGWTDIVAANYNLRTVSFLRNLSGAHP